MKSNRQFRRLMAIPVLFVALGLTCAPYVHAEDIKTLDTLYEVPANSLDLELPESPNRIAGRKLFGIELPEPEPAFVSFAKDCASLDAIPLLELNKNDGRRLFFGINFDGVLGIHGQL